MITLQKRIMKWMKPHLKILCTIFSFVILGGIFSCIQILLLKSIGIGWFMPTYPLWLVRSLVRGNACSDERCIVVLYCRIVLSQVQSSNHRAILSHYLTPLAFTVQQSYTKRYIASFIAFNRTTVALNRTSFVRVLFHMQFFWHQFTDHFYFFRYYEYIVTSARTPIVKRTLHTHLN